MWLASFEPPAQVTILSTDLRISNNHRVEVIAAVRINVDELDRKICVSSVRGHKGTRFT